MDEVVRKELAKPDLRSLGVTGGGCISNGVTYVSQSGEKIFVKVNMKSKAREMFIGEYTSLEYLHAMDIVKVPKPIKVMDAQGGGAMLAMEHLQFGSLRTHSNKLGEQMARLHLLNSELESKSKKAESFVGKSDKYHYTDKFGFDVPTCCGYIAQDNTWEKDWVAFYGRKLQGQLSLIEKEYGDRKAAELWSKLQTILPSFFKGLDIKPALLHGDLWGGNVGEMEEGPVIFDPASFFGHSEYDLGISKMFGGFNQGFFQAYHRVIPQAEGFNSRMELYELFHYLNHWNHFGTSYRDSSIGIMQKLTR
ncbi:hypothetical protein FSP39_021754 [Pinctada imbricata]|uniref:protein-ribulosamine 3-kinase n=1 Tax=Pinctada imbricata TaxID=66713 RepID=A0AA88XL66_PINIB|nr:hypothetical protein FSP39_021754 [Pinctada imbricata]